MAPLQKPAIYSIYNLQLTIIQWGVEILPRKYYRSINHKKTTKYVQPLNFENLFHSPRGKRNLKNGRLSKKKS